MQIFYKTRERETLIQAFDSGHDREFECDIFNKYSTN